MGGIEKPWDMDCLVWTSLLDAYFTVLPFVMCYPFFCCGIDFIIINNYDNVLTCTLYMCVLLKGGGWMSPDGARPGSSGSTKEEDFRLANGMVPHSHTTNGWFCFSIVDCNS